MSDALEVTALEREIEELEAQIARADAEEREVRAWIERAQAAVAEAGAKLPAAEAAVREHRRARPEPSARRTELERRLSDLIEREAVSRMRKEQAERRALGFRAAATFAAAARLDAEKLGEGERVQRERIDEERARHEADLLESRAAGEGAEEVRLASERAQCEVEVNVLRTADAAATEERDAAETALHDLRREIALAQDELERAQYEATRVELDQTRLAESRRNAEERLRVHRREALDHLETKIAEYRAAEADAASRRNEAEGLLRRLREAADAETAAPAKTSSNGVARAPQATPEPAKAVAFDRVPPTDAPTPDAPQSGGEPERLEAALARTQALADARAQQTPPAASRRESGGLLGFVVGLIAGKRR